MEHLKAPHRIWYLFVWAGCNSKTPQIIKLRLSFAHFPLRGEKNPSQIQDNLLLLQGEDDSAALWEKKELMDNLSTPVLRGQRLPPELTPPDVKEGS